MKKLSLRVKLQGGFIIVSLIFLAVGIIGASGISKMIEIVQNLSLHEKIGREIQKSKIAHLLWVHQVTEFQRDENLTELQVEKDPQRCGLGRWLHSETRKRAEAEIPVLSPLFRELEEPHRKLHESVDELERMLKKGKETRNAARQHFATVTHRHVKEKKS